MKKATWKLQASDVYPQCSLYRRTVASVKMSEDSAYLIDIFRVAGGTQHTYSFHVAAEPTAILRSMWGESLESKVGMQDIFVQKPWLRMDKTYDHPQDGWSADYRAKDFWNTYGVPNSEETDVGIKITSLISANNIVTAIGKPPNREGNLSEIPFLFINRYSDKEDLSNVFVTVIEPYKGESKIKSAELLPVTVAGKQGELLKVVAIKILKTDGSIDYVVNSLYGEQVVVDDQFYVDGFWGILSYDNNAQLNDEYLHNGVQIGSLIEPKGDTLTGVVERFTQDISLQNSISVRVDQKTAMADNLKGKYMFGNGRNNSVYLIQGATISGDTLDIDIGSTSIICGKDGAGNYLYDIDIGAAFYIANSLVSNPDVTR